MGSNGKPEFWFDAKGSLWLGHKCVEDYREYTLPESIYHVESREPLTVRHPLIVCGLCKLRGWIENGTWISQGD